MRKFSKIHMLHMLHLVGLGLGGGVLFLFLCVRAHLFFVLFWPRASILLAGWVLCFSDRQG